MRLTFIPPAMTSGPVARKKIVVSGIAAVLMILTVVLPTGCAQNESPTSVSVNPQDVVASIERTACHGTCPVYSLKVYGDGRVVFNGTSYVRVTGNAESTISQEKLALLISEFENAGYFSLNDAYTNLVITDFPTVITSGSFGGKTKTIRHYQGDTGAPKLLTQLEDKIDEIVNSAQWIK